MFSIRVVYLCVGMNDLGGTSSHLRNILHAAPAAGLEPTLWLATKIPEKIRAYFQGVPAQVVIHEHYKKGFYLPLIWKLVQDLRRERVDVIHSFQLQGDIISVVVALLARVPVRISSFEGRLVYGSTLLRRWVLAVLNRMVRPWFTANIFISQHLLRTYGKAYGIAPARCVLNYLGLPPRWFEAPPSPRQKPNPFCIGYVGRVDSEKGYELYIEAVRLLVGRGFSARFKLIGGGHREADARQRIIGAGLEDHLLMTGWIADVRSGLEELDIVVTPSHEEGLSAVAIEALSRKRLVIATRVGGLPEVVEDGVTGYLVEPENPELIANAIEKAAAYWPEAIKKAETGYQVAKERFSSQDEVAGFHALYQRLIGVQA